MNIAEIEYYVRDIQLYHVCYEINEFFTGVLPYINAILCTLRLSRSALDRSPVLMRNGAMLYGFP